MDLANRRGSKGTALVRLTVRVGARVIAARLVLDELPATAVVATGSERLVELLIVSPLSLASETFPRRGLMCFRMAISYRTCVVSSTSSSSR